MRVSRSVFASCLLVVVGAAPAAAQGPEVIEDVGIVVAVVDPATTPDFPSGSMMRADCPAVVWTPGEDGSGTEWIACQLSDEPVMVPERQGSPPAETVSYGGGACTWISDYLTSTEGEDVFAEAFEVVVTASGRVFAWSSYPSEPLDCEPMEAPEASPAIAPSPSGS